MFQSPAATALASKGRASDLRRSFTHGAVCHWPCSCHCSCLCRFARSLFYFYSCLVVAAHIKSLLFLSVTVGKFGARERKWLRGEHVLEKSRTLCDLVSQNTMLKLQRFSVPTSDSAGAGLMMQSSGHACPSPREVLCTLYNSYSSRSIVHAEAGQLSVGSTCLGFGFHVQLPRGLDDTF